MTTHDSDQRPPASISLDLDNLWAYMKIHGDAGWESLPSYLDMLVETVIDRLRAHGLTITVFIVGQDAAQAKNKAALRALANEGHEIGNHSLSHEPWFHTYTPEQVAREIGESEDHIAAATGRRPHGYRGPGFSLTPETLRVLASRGYLYDASTFPTFLGPIARAYYFWSTRGMAKEEREKRDQLYGSVAEGLRPIKPYVWDVAEGARLLEIPVTTMPVARVPFHMSYLIYLAGYSQAAFRLYLRTALAMCRAGRVQPSFLLHPLDFLGGDRVRELAFFPGMKTPSEKKLGWLDTALDEIARHFRPVTMEEHARTLLAGPELQRRTPS